MYGGQSKGETTLKRTKAKSNLPEKEKKKMRTLERPGGGFDVLAKYDGTRQLILLRSF